MPSTRKQTLPSLSLCCRLVAPLLAAGLRLAPCIAWLASAACSEVFCLSHRLPAPPSLCFSTVARTAFLIAAAAPQRSVAAAAFVVEAKQNSLKRQRTAEKARLYNKSRKSEVATRMKKVSYAEGAGQRERGGGGVACGSVACVAAGSGNRHQACRQQHSGHRRQPNSQVAAGNTRLPVQQRAMPVPLARMPARLAARGALCRPVCMLARCAAAAGVCCAGRLQGGAPRGRGGPGPRAGPHQPGLPGWVWVCWRAGCFAGAARRAAVGAPPQAGLRCCPRPR